MRLTLVTETYPPEINGVAMTLGRLVAGLRRRGHRVGVVRPRQDHERGAPEQPDDDTLLVGSLPLPLYPELRLGLPGATRLAAHWRRRRPHVVHVATEGLLGLSALIAARARRLPLTSSYHTRFDLFSRHYGLARVLAPAIRGYLRSFHAHASCTMVPSPDVRQALTADGLRNCRVVGRGVDLDLFHAGRRAERMRRRWEVSDDALVLISTSRLAPEKNLPLTAEAFRAVRARVPGARLVLVGGGPLTEEMRGVEGAVLVGPVPHEEVGAHLAAADLFLFPSLTETFGNVLSEAMACGLPAVAFHYAAAGMHLVNDQNGIAVPVGNERLFVDEAVRLAESPALRRRLGTAASARAATMGWPRIVDSFVGLARDAMRHAPARVGMLAPPEDIDA